MFNTENKIRIAASENEIWDVLVDPKRTPSLFPQGLVCELIDYGDIINGSVVIGSRRMSVRMRKFDVELFDNTARVGLRIKPKNGFCSVLAASVCEDEEESNILAREIDDVLHRLRYEAESPSKTDYGALGTTDDNSEIDAVEVAEEEPPKRFRRPEKMKKKSSRRLAVAVVVTLLLACAATGGIFALRRVAGASKTAGRGALVTLENALSIEMGEKKSEVAWKLGTNGVSDGSSVIYKSDDNTGVGRAARQVCVLYNASDEAETVTYLDVEQASKVVWEIPRPSGISVGMSEADISEAVGRSLSMFRKSAYGVEYHYGYVDPYANFDPAWRGSVVVNDSADGSVTTRLWTPYRGSDALMVEKLDDRLLRQYDSYTDFLNDKFGCDRALEVFKMQYSIGDLEKELGGSLSEYSASGGTRLYELTSTDDNAKITIGLDFEGKFRIASYINKRLFNKENMLDEELCKRLTSGMTYNEVRSIMGVLPTSITVDSATVIMGYGRYLEASRQELQFETVVKYDLTRLTATGVYLNFEGESASWGFGEDEESE